LPGAIVPTRQRLSTAILTRQVNTIEHKIKETMTGGMVTLQRDGLKDTSRKHVVAFMYTANRESHLAGVYDMTEQRKTGENLFSAMEQEMAKLKHMGIDLIGVVGDDGGDEVRC
ncbi:hypothetical protein C8J56DRAFT_774915, partial [Mycena floridula]